MDKMNIERIRIEIRLLGQVLTTAETTPGPSVCVLNYYCIKYKPRNGRRAENDCATESTVGRGTSRPRENNVQDKSVFGDGRSAGHVPDRPPQQSCYTPGPRTSATGKSQKIERERERPREKDKKREGERKKKSFADGFSGKIIFRFHEDGR